MKRMKKINQSILFSKSHYVDKIGWIYFILFLIMDLFLFCVSDLSILYLVLLLASIFMKKKSKRRTSSNELLGGQKNVFLFTIEDNYT